MAATKRRRVLGPGPKRERKLIKHDRAKARVRDLVRRGYRLKYDNASMTYKDAVRKQKGKK